MIKGIIELKGDKSISHRVLILASLSKGKSIIKNLSNGKDVERTISILKNCGIIIKRTKKGACIEGNQLFSTKKRFYCGNSGSTARFMLGYLPSQGISGILYGDRSLSKRPMNRVIEPLKKMNIKLNSNTSTLPISFQASTPTAYHHELTIPSAQVKTALILTSLACNQKCSIKDKFNTRDHTERLIKYLGYKSNHYSKFIPKGFNYKVAGDISNAAFIISAALLIPRSDIIIKGVLYNKTRIGYIKVLKKMGANITISNTEERYNEIICNIHVKHTPCLEGVTLSTDDVTAMIDEIPIFSLVASYAKGVTKVSNAQELRYKESDRIKAIIYNLKKGNINIIEKDDGFIIKGPNILYNTSFKHFQDHRIAMTFEVAKFILTKKLDINPKTDSLVGTSFPEFYKILRALNV